MFASMISTQRQERFVGMPAISGQNSLAGSWLPTHVSFEGCKPVDGYLPATNLVGAPSS